MNYTFVLVLILVTFGFYGFMLVSTIIDDIAEDARRKHDQKMIDNIAKYYVNCGMSKEEALDKAEIEYYMFEDEA